MGRNKMIGELEFKRIQELRKAGWSYKALGEKFGISAVSVYKYLSGKTKFDSTEDDSTEDENP